MAEKQGRGAYGAGTFTQRGKKWSYRVWVTDPETNIPVRKTFTDTTKAKCREQAKSLKRRTGTAIPSSNQSKASLERMGGKVAPYL